VIALRQPLLQTCFSLTQTGVANAHSLKAKLGTPLLDLGGQGRVIILLRKLVLHKSDDNRSGASRHSAVRRELAISLPDETATAAFAARLAKNLAPGLLIYLRGDLGAGKTTLVRALLNALGYQGRVKSPTYTLLEHYEVAGLSLRHFDLYRFRDEAEWETAGFNDEFDGANICLLEWPEQAAGLVPPADVEIFFEILPEGRNISLHAHTDTGKKCLRNL
jgi:tRNA threonylcarbamoyladenosine biosynthesis protein TsaE